LFAELRFPGRVGLGLEPAGNAFAVDYGCVLVGARKGATRLYHLDLKSLELGPMLGRRAIAEIANSTRKRREPLLAPDGAEGGAHRSGGRSSLEPSTARLHAWRVLTRPERREVVSRARHDELMESLGIRQVLEHVRAQGSPACAGRHVLSDESSCHVRDEHLAAVRGVADSCRSMDVEADELIPGERRPAGVYGHPDPDLASLRPRVVANRPLGGCRCRDRLSSV
jgi:hypothetical protein